MCLKLFIHLLERRPLRAQVNALIVLVLLAKALDWGRLVALNSSPVIMGLLGVYLSFDYLMYVGLQRLSSLGATDPLQHGMLMMNLVLPTSPLRVSGRHSPIVTLAVCLQQILLRGVAIEEVLIQAVGGPALSHWGEEILHLEGRLRAPLTNV